MQEFRKSVYRQRRLGGSVGTFNIKSSRVSMGSGTLDITGGEPNEIIDLGFQMSGASGFNSLFFDTPVDVQVLDPLHLNRQGFMTLDSTGQGHALYQFDPLDATASCQVTVLERSSGLVDGVGDSTNVI